MYAFPYRRVHRRHGRPARVRDFERHLPAGRRSLVGPERLVRPAEQPARVHRREPPAAVRFRRPERSDRRRDSYALPPECSILVPRYSPQLLSSYVYCVHS